MWILRAVPVVQQVLRTVSSGKSFQSKKNMKPSHSFCLSPSNCLISLPFILKFLGEKIVLDIFSLVLVLTFPFSSDALCVCVCTRTLILTILGHLTLDHFLQISPQLPWHYFLFIIFSLWPNLPLFFHAYLINGCFPQDSIIKPASFAGYTLSYSPSAQVFNVHFDVHLSQSPA